MEENKETTTATKEKSTPEAKPAAAETKPAANTGARTEQKGPAARTHRSQGRGGRPGGNRGGRRRGDRGGRGERVKPEFEQKIISIRRVTRVVAGGRRFGFSVSLVAGNRNGKVGVGIGKSTDTSLAIEKAVKNAKKNMIEIKRDENSSIPHEVMAKYCTTEILIKPSKGKGLVSGSSARNVLELAGITDVSSKILSRSKNKLNIAQATILALSEFIENK